MMAGITESNVSVRNAPERGAEIRLYFTWTNLLLIPVKQPSDTAQYRSFTFITAACTGCVLYDPIRET